VPQFADEMASIPERSTERLHMRAKKRVKETIQSAARLSGVDDSTFILGSAYQAAIETIRAHEHTELASVDHAAFFAAIDAPADPKPALREAFLRDKARIGSS
jgi:uncharacterized protein (DUF1778 family)